VTPPTEGKKGKLSTCPLSGDSTYEGEGSALLPLETVTPPTEGKKGKLSTCPLSGDSAYGGERRKAPCFSSRRLSPPTEGKV